MQVDCAFPGGNIVVDQIDGDTIRLHQDLRDTQGDWFYFYFRVRGAAGRELKVEFTQSGVLGPFGPAVSFDDGASWSWLGAESLKSNAAFVCRSPPNASSARFAFAVPYTRDNLDAFLRQHNGNPHLRVDQLCLSRKGRVVPQLRLGQRGAACGVALTCRHHACEMVGDYVLEGLIDRLLENDSTGKQLREKIDWLIVPFVDLDGVEDGDQGKNRKPYDHNHDYGEPQIYPEPRAIRKALEEWVGRLRVVLDLHCPWIRGDQNTHVFFSGGCQTWSEVLRFGKLFNTRAAGRLKIDPRFNVAFGEKWNLEHPHLLLKHWASKQAGVQLASALEIPYAVAGGETVLPDAARVFGRDLAVSLGEYLVNSNSAC
jgi:hypothetical protein